MPKKNTKRKLFGLVSEETGDRIYYAERNTQNSEKLSLRKYNPKTRRHEVFTETKKNLGRNEVKARKH